MQYASCLCVEKNGFDSHLKNEPGCFVRAWVGWVGGMFAFAFVLVLMVECFGVHNFRVKASMPAQEEHAGGF